MKKIFAISLISLQATCFGMGEYEKLLEEMPTFGAKYFDNDTLTCCSRSTHAAWGDPKYSSDEEMYKKMLELEEQGVPSIDQELLNKFYTQMIHNRNVVYQPLAKHLYHLGAKNNSSCCDTCGMVSFNATKFSDLPGGYKENCNKGAITALPFIIVCLPFQACTYCAHVGASVDGYQRPPAAVKMDSNSQVPLLKK